MSDTRYTGLVFAFGHTLVLCVYMLNSSLAGANGIPGQVECQIRDVTGVDFVGGYSPVLCVYTSYSFVDGVWIPLQIKL